jgi:hypothetical protein
VRRIRTKEYVNGMDKDLIEDPNLPPLPAPHLSLPRVSLTLLGLSNVLAPGRPKEEPVLPGGAPLAAILKDPASFAGRPVKIVGQFRGRNLFGDLPEGSQRRPNDWVIRAGEQSAWVTDKPPKGKGFTLDASYKGDTSRWLEVEAKAEVVDGVVYLKASKVTLAPRRKEEQ